MKKQFITLAIIGLFIVVVFSGCTEQQGTKTDSENQLPIGSNDLFSVDGKGGDFSLLQDTIKISVPSGAVTQQVDITVAAISNPVSDPSLIMFSCYEFGPDGQSFERPIDVIIRYNVNDIPAGLSESDIQIYVLTGDNWEPLEGSFANTAMHWAVAKVSHFSKMGCSAPASSSSDSDNDDGDDDSDDEGSAQYWFKANLNFFNHKDLRLVDWDDDDMYMYGVSVYWDPVPYVQYYEIKFEFYNNPPTTAYAWGCDFREQDEPWCSKKTPYNKKQGYIYHLGGDPSLEGYLTLYDSDGTITAQKYNKETGEMEYYTVARIFPEGKHGFGFFGVHDTVDDAEKFTDLQIGVIRSQMEGFVQDYVENWEIWVRGVTERGD